MMWFDGMGMLEAYQYENKAIELLKQAMESAERDYDDYAREYILKVKSVITLLDSNANVGV